MNEQCPICDSQKLAEVFPDELLGSTATVDYNFSPKTRLTYRIVDCRDCTHRFVSPLPSISSTYVENEDPTYLASLPQRQRSAREWLTTVTRYSPDARSLLDVGCATGVFLDVASELLHVEGVELSHWAAQIAVRRHIVHQRAVSELGLDQQFDVVTLWGVIEHFEHLQCELDAIRSLTVSGGHLFIYTGDREALLPRLLGKRWWWYQGMHLQYFSRKTLTQLLKQSGFEVIAVHRLPVFFSLSSLGQSLNRYRLFRPLVWLLKQLPQNRMLIRLTLSGEMLLVAKRP
jgi:2-polyprenyl-3-methyl-5-hydroxy-6-metoxy-1,4-benzoquinol methylase